MIQSAAIVAALALLLGAAAPLQARETVEVELDLSGVPGWIAFAKADQKTALTDLEKKLVKKLAELLPAWDFTPGSKAATRLIFRFTVKGQSNVENAGVLTNVQLKTPGMPDKPWFHEGAVELWAPGSPEWGNAVSRGAWESAAFLRERLFAALDNHWEACREDFCRRIPVAQQAGYHSDRRGWIAFFENDYTYATFRISWTVPGKPPLTFSGTGIGLRYNAPGLMNIACLVIEGGQDEPALKPNQQRAVFLQSLDGGSGADTAPK